MENSFGKIATTRVSRSGLLMLQCEILKHSIANVMPLFGSDTFARVLSKFSSSHEETSALAITVLGPRLLPRGWSIE